MYVTYAKISGAIIIGSTYDTKEDAEKGAKFRGEKWGWVEVGHNDDSFAGYITGWLTSIPVVIIPGTENAVSEPHPAKVYMDEIEFLEE